MIADEILSDLIRSAVLSAKALCAETIPLSLFLIAPIENGKTSLAIENAGEKPLILSDLSGIGLLEALYQEKTVTHVVINDLAAVGGHKTSVSKLTISILNGLAEEGCFKIALPRMGHLDLSGRRIGVIACSTPDLVEDNRMWWKRSGFASRVLSVRFSHSINLQVKILQSIANGNSIGFHKSVLRIPEVAIRVRIGKTEAQKLLVLSQQIARHHQEIGYRRQKQIRSLACGHALLRTWRRPAVNKYDLNFVEKCLPFLTSGKEI
jgi:hypothetical protein